MYQKNMIKKCNKLQLISKIDKLYTHTTCKLYFTCFKIFLSFYYFSICLTMFKPTLKIFFDAKLSNLSVINLFIKKSTQK